MTWRVTTSGGRELEDAASDDAAQEIARRYNATTGDQAKVTRILDGEAKGKPVTVGADKDAKDDD